MGQQQSRRLRRVEKNEEKNACGALSGGMSELNGDGAEHATKEENIVSSFENKNNICTSRTASTGACGDGGKLSVNAISLCEAKSIPSDLDVNYMNTSPSNQISPHWRRSVAVSR